MGADGPPFAGEIAVVTGGTQGVGTEIASLLAGRGATGLLITGVRKIAAQTLQRRLRPRGIEPCLCRPTLLIILT